MFLIKNQISINKQFYKSIIMKSKYSTFFYTALIGGLLVSGCSKDDATPGNKGKYIIMTQDPISSTAAGYVSTYANLPSGTFSNISGNSTQALGTAGELTPFGQWIFKASNSAGETGIQKYSISTEGKLKDEGFITSHDNRFYIISETEGYYWDSDLGRLKIQKFNPSTMQRTGEIDLTSKLNKSGESYITAGQHVIAVHNGKLYADIYYGTSASSIGFADMKYDTVYMAVVDLSTSAYVKTIKLPGIKGGIGFLSDNPFWTKASDGTMYFSCLGNVGSAASKIIRIKNGESDFDKNWALNISDYQAGSSFVNIYVKDNKLYTQVSTEAIKSDFSNLYNEMWEYYAIDLNTKAATKVEGIGTPVLFTGHSRSISEIDGKIYLRVINSKSGTNGYYVLSGNHTTEAFKISEGGNVQDFFKLQ